MLYRAGVLCFRRQPLVSARAPPRTPHRTWVSGLLRRLLPRAPQTARVPTSLTVWGAPGMCFVQRASPGSSCCCSPWPSWSFGGRLLPPPARVHAGTRFPWVSATAPRLRSASGASVRVSERSSAFSLCVCPLCRGSVCGPHSGVRCRSSAGVCRNGLSCVHRTLVSACACVSSLTHANLSPRTPASDSGLVPPCFLGLLTYTCSVHCVPGPLCPMSLTCP